MVIIEVEVSMGEKKVIIIIIKKFIMGICAPKLNLFRSIARVSCRRVYRWELKLIVVCLTIL